MFYRNPMILGIALALLGGCGQKGPLYLPKDDPAAEQHASLPQALLNAARRTPKTPERPASSASAPDAAASSSSPAQPVTP